MCFYGLKYLDQLPTIVPLQTLNVVSSAGVFFPDNAPQLPLNKTLPLFESRFRVYLVYVLNGDV